MSSNNVDAIPECLIFRYPTVSWVAVRICCMPSVTSATFDIQSCIFKHPRSYSYMCAYLHVSRHKSRKCIQLMNCLRIALYFIEAPTPTTEQTLTVDTLRVRYSNQWSHIPEHIPEVMDIVVRALITTRNILSHHLSEKWIQENIFSSEATQITPKSGGSIKRRTPLIM